MQHSTLLYIAHRDIYDEKMQNAFQDFNILYNKHFCDTSYRDGMLNVFLINGCKNQDH
jgi:hypothetical protein